MLDPTGQTSQRRWTLAVIAVALARAGPAVGGEVTGIAVESGRADFDLAPGVPGATTLVVVAALGRGPGPFPVSLRTSAIGGGEARPLRIAVDPPPRWPRSVTLPPGQMSSQTDRRPPASRRFSLLVRDGDVASATNYEVAEARLAAVGARVQVYVDERDRDLVDPGTLREVVATFDAEVYPLAARRFGPAEDVDGDGRFTVFLSGRLGRLAGGRVKVDGFVRGADFDEGLSSPFGNRCDMMYLNASLRPGPHLKTVLAHEYTHAVTFSRRAFPRGADGRLGIEEDGWLDEGLAHLVEDAHGFSRSNLDYRISAFLSRPEAYRLVVEDYYAAELFRSHGCRGGTYLFLRWCVDRFGDGLLDALIRSDLRGEANLEAATGRSFASLYREWSVSLFMSGVDPEGDDGRPGGYKTIDPRGMLEDYVLAGPRPSRVRPGGGPDTWLASGTSSHYILIETAVDRPVRVVVEGPASADLQVTVVCLEGDPGGLDLDVRATPGRPGEVSVRARVSTRGGEPIRLGAIAWEPLVPPDAVSVGGSRRGGLDMLGIARRFAGSRVDPGQRLASVPIVLDGVRPGDGPIILKAVGTDAKGRRVAGWAEIDVRPDPADDVAGR